MLKTSHESIFENYSVSREPASETLRKQVEICRGEPCG